MSSWLTWIPLVINSTISIISIHFLFKLYKNILKHVECYTKQQSAENNKETFCERCKGIIASSAAEKRINYNKNQKLSFDDESSHRRLHSDDSQHNNFNGGSSDNDPTIVGHVTTRKVIDYDGQNENQICHTKYSVSMLRKQFENVDNKKAVRNLERQISEKFFERTKTPPAQEDDETSSGTLSTSINDYYVIEQTKVHKVLNNNNKNKETINRIESPTSPSAVPADKISKILLSKRSHSNGDIKRIKRSPSHDVIAEEPFALKERTKSLEQMVKDSDDVEYRNISIGNNRRSVRTVDDILQQERFSKCYSEYSISDLLNDMADDDESDFASFFNKN